MKLEFIERSNTMKTLLEETIELRHQLHQIPEKSECEVKTMALLKEWIKNHLNNPNYELVDKQTWFYVVYKSVNPTRKPIAYRADMDAVTVNEEVVRHLCGHEGHSATLAGYLVSLQDQTFDRDIYFVFQHAEENGAGGKVCATLMKEKDIEEVYAYHNIPKYETGTCLIKEKTFACSSTGLILRFIGAISHAAYPELGKNPTYAVAKVINYIEEFNKKERDYIEFATIVGSKMGNASFGVACGDADLMVTIRSEIEDHVHELVREVLELSETLAKEYDLEFSHEFVDPFPMTYNTPERVNKVIEVCKENNIPVEILKEPFRWCEDFGQFLKQTEGSIFGLGNGINSEGLHTDNYEFNDEIITNAWTIFKGLI